MTTPKNAPVDHVRLGAIQAAIWANETDSGLRYSVTFERRYFDAKAEEWKSSGSYNRDDLLVLAKAADLAHSRIHELQTLSRAKQPETADEADASETQSPPPAHAAGGASASDSSTPTRAARTRSRSGAGR